MPASGDTVRRRQACVLVVGNVEPEVQPWLRAGRHAISAVRDVQEASKALDETPADLVIVDRAGKLDAADVCRALREDARLDEAWLLAITVQAQGRMADAVLDAGADDYLHRPFSRAELLARARAGLRAAQQRADDALMRAMMDNVPGAIYRSAWHADYALELISDEIERISGYPAANFLASRRRTLMSVIHPDDHEHVLKTVSQAHADGEPFSFEYRIVRADGEVRWVLDRGQLVSSAGGRLWCDGAIFDITERRKAEEALRRREIEQARTDELRASRARIVEAADNARRRIERDLHDGAQQRLVGLTLEVRMARARVETDPEAAGPFLDHVAEALGEASAELRELARGIHPAAAHRARARPGHHRARLARARARRGRRAARGATAGGDRGDRLLHGRRGADQRRQVRRRQPRQRAARARERGAGDRDPRRRQGRRRGRPGLRPQRPRRPSRRARRRAAVESPPGAGTVVRARLPL